MANAAAVRSRTPAAARATLRYVRGSASKTRLVLEQIRGKSYVQAAETLKFSERRIAGKVLQCLESAGANAESNKQLDTEDLFVLECYADLGPSIKRWRPRARGRATPILKRTCHITVVLGRFTAEEREIRASRSSAAQEARRRRVEASRAAAAAKEETDEPDDAESSDAPEDSTEEVDTAADADAPEGSAEETDTAPDDADAPDDAEAEEAAADTDSADALDAEAEGREDEAEPSDTDGNTDKGAGEKAGKGTGKNADEKAGKKAEKN